MRTFVLYSATTLLLFATLCTAITFDLPYGQQKCFSEDVSPSVTVRGAVHVAGGRGQGDMKLDVYVTNPQGVVAFHRMDVNAVKFTFKTSSFQEHTTQAYRICVLHQLERGRAHHAHHKAYRRITLEFEMAREKASMKSLASKQHVDKLHQSFHEVSISVDKLIEGMDDLRMREQALTNVSSDTSSVIVRIAIVACLFTILTGVLNFMSLKSFFKQKKLA